MATPDGYDVSISISSCGSGFQGPGDKCYLASILDCLSRTPKLAANFEHYTSSATGNYLRGLARNRPIALPLELTRLFSVSGQQGASEYLLKLLKYISGSLQHTGENSPFVSDIFAGSHNSRFTCLRCGYCYQTSGVRFNHLTIPAGNFTNVSDAVAAFTAAKVQAREHLLKCATCGVKSEVRRVAIASYVRCEGH
jgi:ubiquitin C-terminal hydrolase